MAPQVKIRVTVVSQDVNDTSIYVAVSICSSVVLSCCSVRLQGSTVDLLSVLPVVVVVLFLRCIIACIVLGLVFDEETGSVYGTFA